MAPFKAPGPDGFQAGFYHANWEAVKESVCKFVKEAFITGHFDESFSKVLIVLILKVDNWERVSHLCPISLCNVSVKLILKIIMGRLRRYLKDIISPTQSSFIPGRGSTDNIVVVQEAVHSLRRKQGKIYGLIMKIDLEKA